MSDVQSVEMDKGILQEIPVSEIIYPSAKLLGKIYIPLVQPRAMPLHVLVMETYGRPIRYFYNKDEAPLRAIGYMMKNPSKIDVGMIRVGDLCSWEVTAELSTCSDPYYMQNNNHGVRAIPLTRLEDVYSLDCPIEFREALLATVFKLLNS